MILDKKRIQKDENELFHYGVSSTQLYLNYRECIDKRLKLVMLEVAKVYEEEYSEDFDIINNHLLQQYKAFWNIAESIFQKFYEEIQEILSLNDVILPKDLLNSNNILTGTKLSESEIERLEEKYLKDKLYCQSLKEHKEKIEVACIPLQDKIISASKLHKEYMTKLKNVHKLSEKIQETTETLTSNNTISCLRPIDSNVNSAVRKKTLNKLLRQACQ
ncbi:uncharacterized protein LOC115879802 [Sitophilus oryzae]|uniref:Uncharacterized protein LOC115879802 n=1 Tax=Sitophilus oryzae TaxID=7048 RepID=A0A6J2XP63_SITOR|nr:uncharacterized protein LOC115879802 [Sitophilus oryzae]